MSNTYERQVQDEAASRMIAIQLAHDMKRYTFSEETKQALLLFVGCSPAKTSGIRLSEGNFTVYNGKKYVKANMFQFINDLIVNGRVQNKSSWGDSVIGEDKTKKQAGRDLKVREKIYELIHDLPQFQLVLDKFVADRPTTYADPFAPFVNKRQREKAKAVCRDTDESNAEALPPKKRSKKAAAAEPTTSPQAAAEPPTPPQAAAEPPTSPQAAAEPPPVDPQKTSPAAADAPPQAAAHSDTESDSDEGGEEYQADDNESSESSSESSDPEESEEESDSHRTRAAAAAEQPPPPELSFFEKAAAMLQEAGGLASHLETFQKAHMPKKEDICKAPRVTRKSKPVLADRRSCELASAMIEAKQRKSPAIEAFLRNPENWQRPLREGQIDCVLQLVGLLGSNVSLQRAILSAGVGGGKTAICAVLARLALMGMIPGLIAQAFAVVAPAQLGEQWGEEIKNTDKNCEVVVVKNVEETLAGLKEFYRKCYNNDGTKVVFLVIPSHLFDNEKWIETTKYIDSITALMWFLDEPHGHFKNGFGQAGGSLASFFQNTSKSATPKPMVAVTATPISKADEALAVLQGMMGLSILVPSNAMEDPNNKEVVQGILKSLCVEAQPNPSESVPPPPLYILEVQPPDIDGDASASVLARQFRAGNGVPWEKNPMVTSALLAAMFFQRKKRKGSLIFLDDVKNMENIRKAIKGTAWEYLIFFLNGDLTLAERESTMQKMRASEEPIILIITLNLGGVGHNWQRFFSYVIFAGACVFSEGEEYQCIARVARFPKQERVLAIKFISADCYSRGSQEIQKNKRLKTATFTGQVFDGRTARFFAARDGSEICVRRRPLVTLDTLFPVLAGLDALASGGFACHPSFSFCYAVAQNSQLMPPAKTKDAKKQYPDMVRRIQEAIDDARDPEAAKKREETATMLKNAEIAKQEEEKARKIREEAQQTQKRKEDELQEEEPKAPPAQALEVAGQVLTDQVANNLILHAALRANPTDLGQNTVLALLQLMNLSTSQRAAASAEEAQGTEAAPSAGHAQGTEAAASADPDAGSLFSQCANYESLVQKFMSSRGRE